MGYNISGGVSLKCIVEYLEKFAKKALSESWDNTGLLVEPYSAKAVNKILLTNDLTEDVVEEAVNEGTDLIISYHPPIFQPLKSITRSTWKERIIGACVENKIAVYSPHTSWDSVPGGINDWLTSAFDTESVSPIIKKDDVHMENAGAGRNCTLKDEITLSKAVENVKSLIGQSHVQVALSRGSNLESKISTVAVCAGSGSSVLEKCPAQLYVTGEMSHHSLLEATHNGSTVILCNHSNSERGFLKVFAKKLDDEFGGRNVKSTTSQRDRDPLQVV